MLGAEAEHAGAGIGVNVDCSVGFGGEDCLAACSRCDGGLEGFSPPQKEDERLGAPRQCSDAGATTRQRLKMAEVQRW
jgi:hypothetical protein